MSDTLKNIEPIVFYDGSCPLCTREIKHYIQIDRNKHINWEDISTDTSLLKQHDIAYADAMKKLHVIDHYGKTKIGVDAFLTIWQLIPYYRYLAKVVIFLRIKKPMTLVYEVFAKQRYRKFMLRQLCTASCKLQTK